MLSPQVMYTMCKDDQQEISHYNPVILTGRETLSYVIIVVHLSAQQFKLQVSAQQFKSSYSLQLKSRKKRGGVQPAFQSPHPIYDLIKVAS